MKVVIATRNPGKYEELHEMLKVDGVEFVPITDWDLPDVEETGSTFKENAKLKADYAARNTGLFSLADDSGVEIEVLGGYPGIYSARCAGLNATDEEKRQHLLKIMEGVEDRRVRFTCSIVICEPSGTGLHYVFTRSCEGLLTTEVIGEAREQVQYDSIFYYPELGKTFAELSKAEKNEVSHRGQAAGDARDFIEKYLRGDTFIKRVADALVRKGKNVL